MKQLPSIKQEIDKQKYICQDVISFFDESDNSIYYKCLKAETYCNCNTRISDIFCDKCKGNNNYLINKLLKHIIDIKVRAGKFNFDDFVGKIKVDFSKEQLRTIFLLLAKRQFVAKDELLAKVVELGLDND